MPADLRSVHPRFVGFPWWGAALLAVTATAIGFAFDAGSGDRELSAAFATCYVIGCLLAVLGVRQSGVFTAVIQPPLILFVTVPGAYFLFHGGELGGLKDLAINCGYPLIERFPLMLFTSAAVLLIGLARWYLGLTARHHDEDSATGKGTRSQAPAKFVSSLTAKMSGLLYRKPAKRPSAAQDPAGEPRPRRRPSDRPRRRPAPASRAAEAAAGGAAAGGAAAGAPGEGRPARSPRKPSKRTGETRPRPRRPAAEQEQADPIPERPRRPRAPRASEPPLVPPAEPRRRVRTQPREPRRQPPPERRGGYDRPQRGRRFDDYQPFEDPFEDFEPPNGRQGRSTHHPVSRVRYRGSEDEDRRTEYRTRPRPPRGTAPRGSARGRHSRDYDD
ncbi:DUF6542 domain-containing protein [Mycobacterium sp. NPDC003449]